MVDLLRSLVSCGYTLWMTVTVGSVIDYGPVPLPFSLEHADAMCTTGHRLNFKFGNLELFRPTLKVDIKNAKITLDFQSDS